MRRLLEPCILFGAALLLANTVSASQDPAQPREQAPAAIPPGSRPPHHQARAWTNADRLRELTRSLDLSAEQQARVKEILDNRQARALQIMAADSLAAVERVHRLQELDRTAVEAIKRVLTPAQLRKYDPAGQGAPQSTGDVSHAATRAS